MPGGGGPTSTTTNTSNLPEYAKPYFEELLNRTAGVTQQPYQPYADAQGNALPRLAGFGQDTQAAMEMTRQNVGIGAGDLNSARSAMGSAVNAGLNLQNFQPGSFEGGYQGASYSPTSFDAGYQTASFGPGQFNSGYQTSSYAPTNFHAQNVGASFAPSSFNSGYSGPGDYQERAFGADQVQAGRASTGTFNTAAANQYMSPYIDTVMDRQKDAALRDFRIGQADRDTQAIRSGAFGGSRAAIQQGMAEEGLSRQIGDIDAQGRQMAFQQAMSQFNQDQGRDLQAQGMTLDQSLRSQLANQSANMQAQQLSEQSNQFGFGATEAGRQRAAELGLTAQQAADASRRFGADLDIRGQLANQSAGLQAQQMAEQSRQFGSQFTDASNRFAADAASRDQQALEQSRQFGAQFADASNRFAAQTALQEQQAAEQANQFGAGFMDSSNRFGADMALREQGMNEAARQQAAQLGLSGAQLAMSGGQGIASLGMMNQQMANNDANALMRTGATQDALAQQAFDVNYQNYLNQRDFDRNQAQFYSSILRGVPVTASSETSQFTNPNPVSQLAGLGVAGAGAYRLATG